MVTIYKKTIAVSVQTFSISACLKIVRNLKVHVSNSATFHIKTVPPQPQRKQQQ